MKKIMGIDFSKLQFVGEANVTKENGGITCEELFKVGSIWKNKKFLHECVRVYAARTGWHPSLKFGNSILCSCFGGPQRTSRLLSQGTIKKNCTLKILMTSSHYKVKKRKNGRPVHIQSFPDDAHASISPKSIFNHGGTCTPSIQQQIVQRSRSGDYINKINNLQFL